MSPSEPVVPSAEARAALSVIIISLNEAEHLPRCLASVAWATERIVVDSGSTDGTRAVCAALGAVFVEHTDWQGFGIQKNRALARAGGAWVLSIDADEWVTPELRAEIEAVLACNHDVDAYRMPRRSSYCGRFLSHGGWWPDPVVRLFRRGRASFSEDRVHERLLVQGPIADLRTPLLHEAFVDLEEVLQKVDRYSTLGAQAMADHGRSASLRGALAHGVWAFVRTYVLRAGFLDGSAGFMLAVSNAEGTYYRYAKRALQLKQGRL